MWMPSSLVKPTRCCCLLLVLVICGCERSSTQNRGKGPGKNDLVAVDEPQAAIVDPDYCFRIESPGDRWKLLPEKEVMRILPDAVAGAVSVGGCYGVVLVEPLVDNDLAAYVSLIRDGNRIPGGELTPTRATAFHARPAMRFGQSGTVSGVDFRYEYQVFLHQGFGYQLVAWSVAKQFSDGDIQAFFDAFHLTDGKVRARSSTLPIADFEGVGQRVVDGRFESAVYKLTVDPPRGWQLMVGASLREASEDAEIGLSNASLGTYLVVIPEYIGNADQEAHRQLLLANAEAGLGIGAGGGRVLDPLSMAVCGVSVDFRRYVTEAGMAFRYYLGVHFVDTCCYQILAWHLESNDSPPEKELAAAVKSIRFLDDQHTAQLKKEMRARPDPENTIGPGYCLRNGVYRNFEHGVTWTKPTGFWRAAVGDDARARNDSCSLLAEEPQSGLYVQWIVEEAGDFNAATFHRVVLASTFGEDHPIVNRVPESLALTGATALVSEAEVRTGNLVIVYRVATAIANRRAHQMLVWGLPENMKRGRQQIDQALTGFAFPGSKLIEVINAPPTYRDNRAGFSLRLPGSGWTVRDNLRPEFQAIGSMLQFQRRNQGILVIALASFEPGQDVSWAADTIKNMWAVNFSRFMSAKPTTNQAPFAGISWQLETWRKGGESVHTAVAVRQRTIYALIVTGTEGTGRTIMNRVMKDFRLLD